MRIFSKTVGIKKYSIAMKIKNMIYALGQYFDMVCIIISETLFCGYEGII